MINFNFKLAKAFKFFWTLQNIQATQNSIITTFVKKTDASKRRLIGFHKQTILIILVSITFYAKHGKKSIRQQLLDNLAYQ